MAVYTWELDKAHSEVQFKIRHLVISNIAGIFREFKATVQTPETFSFTNAVFKITFDVFSIETDSSEYTEKLKSENVFNADNWPEVRFESEAFTHIDGDKHLLSGNLSVKSITKPFTFNVIFGGYMKDGFGLNRAVFDIKGTINRNEFDLHEKDVNEAGGFILGEDIDLHAILNFTFKPEETYNYR